MYFLTARTLELRLVTVISKNNSQPHSLNSSDENWKSIYTPVHIFPRRLLARQCHVKHSIRLCYAYILSHPISSSSPFAICTRLGGHMTPHKQGTITQGAANARRHISSYTSDLARKKPNTLSYCSSSTEKRNKKQYNVCLDLTPKRGLVLLRKRGEIS